MSVTAALDGLTEAIGELTEDQAGGLLDAVNQFLLTGESALLGAGVERGGFLDALDDMEQAISDGVASWQ